MVDELEYRLPEVVARPNFAAILDEDDRFVARQMYLKQMEKNLNMLAEIEREKPELYALIEMNISEWSEVEIKKCTNFEIIQTHQLAPTGDPLIDEDVAAQAYHTMKQNPAKSTNKYRVRMEDTLKVMERIGIDLPTPQQQAMRYLKYLDRAKH